MTTSKNKLIIAIIILVVVAGGVLFFLNRGPSYQKESLTIEQDLTPIELTQEEKQALQAEGLTMPSREDAAAKNLQSVRTSDELDAIGADLNETDLSSLDAEL
ncbi:hypothetical protein A3G55_02875 [Candidatus Giovannonibacteria bacterium RIFCSPLOWO2_12_FULL_44_25]|uniref:Uncharacterized protein n=3 Tax=Candidatus Giovannoniibacteriota TaxID=1752738 RepID=A0A0G1ID15_9BACT|nr:MAG: hypothetical protein UW15_C0033G0011 [Parcubacteria group bacterium GW2011_GWC1_44_10]KKT57095.1 MAG: hypothetical protein UW49_C0008G0057 [Candidatus Giovannonibacteria bacterium GW2011_GWB1_44_23]KKT59532.1 MAG: hypothetical protein UW53_C0011G0061 [Candidatus Giovannonibacteria bacterium GW2011_GWA1_44_25]OGF49979.1 MAG: hypothetical protein A2120_04700 [Candidatus Giovannonibacteria bacterium GWA2_45_15]OGF59268.1 MAG: hypothetical protein A2W40_03780 [Candidatus Giovannonibacteria 